MFQNRNLLLSSRVSVVCLFAAALLSAVACNSDERVSAPERKAIADTLQKLVVQAYDFSKRDVSARLLSLYPDSGRVISASGGNVTASRTALQDAIAGFWERVGQNMQQPKFVLGSAYVDVITRNAAVMTFTYSIPHLTPRGSPHTVSGAWTALFRRQDGRWKIVQEHLSDTPESTQSADSLAAAAKAGQQMAMPDAPNGTKPRPMPKMKMPGGGRK